MHRHRLLCYNFPSLTHTLNFPSFTIFLSFSHCNLRHLEYSSIDFRGFSCDTLHHRQFHLNFSSSFFFTEKITPKDNLPFYDFLSVFLRVFYILEIIPFQNLSRISLITIAIPSDSRLFRHTDA